MEEREIKQLFERQRELDQTNLPPLESLVEPPSRSSAARGWPRWRAAAASGVLVLALSGGYAGYRLLDSDSKGPALSQWKSPTAFLLRPPGGEILRGSARITTDYLMPGGLSSTRSERPAPESIEEKK